MRQERFSNLTILNRHKEKHRDTEFLLLTLLTKFPIVTVTEIEILATLKNLIYSKYQPLPHLYFSFNGLYRFGIISIRLDGPFINR